MRIYIKPKITIEIISIKDAIAEMTLSNRNPADFDNCDSDSWSNWEDLFK